MHIPLLHKTTLALAVDDEMVSWALASGMFGKIQSVKTGSFALDNNAAIHAEALLQTAGKHCAIGALVEERFVRHRLSNPGSSHGSNYVEDVERLKANLIPSNTDPEVTENDFCFAGDTTTTNGQQTTYCSAISKAAYCRTVEQLASLDITPLVFSTLSQDLPYALAYRDSFMAGNETVLYANAEYSVLFHYINGVFKSASIHRGSAPEIRLDVEASVQSAQNANSKSNPTLVVGPACTRFLDAVADHSGAVTFRVAETTLRSRATSPADKLHVSALAIRLFYDVPTGTNFASTTFALERLRAQYEALLKTGFKVAAYVVAIVCLLGILALVLANYRLDKLNDENVFLEGQANQLRLSQARTEVSREKSTAYQLILSRQTNFASVLEMIGRANPDRITLTSISAAPDHPSSSVQFKINGSTPDASYVALFTKLLEQSPSIQTVDLKNVAASRRRSASDARVIEFELVSSVTKLSNDASTTQVRHD